MQRPYTQVSDYSTAFPIRNLGCICETQNREKGVPHIFLMGCFIEFCENIRKSNLRGDYRLFLNYAQYLTTIDDNGIPGRNFR
jgi:hypothetical protein